MIGVTFRGCNVGEIPTVTLHCDDHGDLTLNVSESEAVLKTTFDGGTMPCGCSVKGRAD